jgi:hypothetical protein
LHTIIFFNANIFIKGVKENVKGTEEDKTAIEKDRLKDE